MCPIFLSALTWKAFTNFLLDTTSHTSISVCVHICRQGGIVYDLVSLHSNYE